MGCSGLHCNGCGHSNKGGRIAIAIGLLLGSIVAIEWLHKQAHIITHVADDIIQIMVIAFISVIILTLVTVSAIVTVKVRRNITKKNGVESLINNSHDAIGNDRRELPIYIPSVQTKIIRNRHNG